MNPCDYGTNGTYIFGVISFLAGVLVCLVFLGWALDEPQPEEEHGKNEA